VAAENPADRGICAPVQWKVRRGLSGPAPSTPGAQKLEALQTGVCGETYAYWYLRRLGYIFIARNHMPEHAKGELDLIGFGDTLALIELSITRGKTRNPYSHRALLPSRAPHQRVPFAL
jgi:hypothetical protein